MSVKKARPGRPELDIHQVLDHLECRARWLAYASKQTTAMAAAALVFFVRLA